MFNPPAYLQRQIPLARELGRQLRGAGRVLVIPHRKPDGDCMGAATAVLQLCDIWGIPADGFCIDPVPSYLRFLPVQQRILTDSAALASFYDVVLLVDAEVKMAGVDDMLDKLPHRSLCLIDHHATTSAYGSDVALLAPEASSTCEMLHYLFRSWAVPLTPDLATSLLCGLVTDTATFSNPGVTTAALAAGAELVIAGARWHEVVNSTTRTRPLSAWRLWGAGLARLRHLPSRNMAVTYILRDEVKATGAEGIEGLSNFIAAHCAVPTVMVVREQTDGTLKGSIRTTTEELDVAAMAASFGGGGHRKASGFVLQGRLQEQADGSVAVVGEPSPELMALQAVLSES
jgi:phosphoesterase RecJ-like protein